MKHTILLLFTIVALTALFGGKAVAAPAKRPNIIFILTDDLGVGDVGVFFQNARRARNNRAEPSHRTPHLDAMAA